MKKLKKYRLVLIVLIILVVIYFSFYNDITFAKVDSEVIQNKDEIVSTIKVDIKGAVKNPGVYEVNKDFRVIDVVNLSGGLTKNAETKTINLSKKLVDEMVIYVYAKEDINTTPTIKVDVKGCVNNPNVYEISNTARVIDAIKLAGGFSELADITKVNLSKKIVDEMLINVNCIQEFNEEINENVNDKININMATLQELMTLEGIGESKALKIIEYREKNTFNDISDIINVSGISETIYEKIKDNISV